MVSFAYYIIAPLVLFMSGPVVAPDNDADRPSKMEFTICKTWNNQPLPQSQQVKITFSAAPAFAPANHTGDGPPAGLIVEVDAPFYDDPHMDPNTPKGPTFSLWDYEVVEAFFLSGERYLEVELGPRGQHLLLLLNGKHNVLKHSLELEEYQTSLEGEEKEQEKRRWRGRALIPWQYFPQRVDRFNAYAIHGSGAHRVYSALFPTTTGLHQVPDYHRLEYFQPLNFSALLPQNKETQSDLWKQLLIDSNQKKDQLQK